MRQDLKGLSHQDVYDKLRSIRTDIKLMRSTIIHIYASNNDERRINEGLSDSIDWLKEARHTLRRVIEIICTSGTYPEPLTDTPSSQPPPFGLTNKSLKILSKEIGSRRDKLEDLTLAIAEHHLEGWAIRYTEDAVMSLNKASQELKICSKILPNETSDTRERESVSGSADDLRDASRGISVSGRAGQH